MVDDKVIKVENNKDPLVVNLGPATCFFLGVCTLGFVFTANKICDAITAYKSVANEISQTMIETKDHVVFLRGDLGVINNRIGNFPLVLEKIIAENKQSDPKAEVAKDILSVMERADEGSSITVRTNDKGQRVFVVRSEGKIYEVSASNGKKTAYPRPSLQ